jgi:hypothetical protein
VNRKIRILEKPAVGGFTYEVYILGQQFTQWILSRKREEKALNVKVT